VRYPGSASSTQGGSGSSFVGRPLRDPLRPVGDASGERSRARASKGRRRPLRHRYSDSDFAGWVSASCCRSGTPDRLEPVTSGSGVIALSGGAGWCGAVYSWHYAKFSEGVATECDPLRGLGPKGSNARSSEEGKRQPRHCGASGVRSPSAGRRARSIPRACGPIDEFQGPR
jgi:hypothetical protein